MKRSLNLALMLVFSSISLVADWYYSNVHTATLSQGVHEISRVAGDGTGTCISRRN